jgi:hypothetical protein
LRNHAEVDAEYHYEKDNDHWAARFYTFSSEETSKPSHDNGNKNGLDKNTHKEPKLLQDIKERLLAEDNPGKGHAYGHNKVEGKPHHHHNHMIIEIGSQEEPEGENVPNALITSMDSTEKQTSIESSSHVGSN